jgi:hypothetical protein
MSAGADLLLIAALVGVDARRTEGLAGKLVCRRSALLLASLVSC